MIRKAWTASLTAAGYFLAQFSASAQAPVPDPLPAVAGSAAIQFAATNHDFGRVVEGNIVQKEFAFVNAGNAPLEISGVKPDCGCTSSTNWSRRVDPGQRGVIPVQFKSAGFLGQLSKSVTVFCNDPAKSNVVLRYTAQVWNPVGVMPGTVFFSLTSEWQTNETRVVKITNNDTEEMLLLSEPTSDQRLFKPTLKTNKLGQEYELEVGLVGRVTGTNTAGSITIPASSTKRPKVTVQAVAVLQAPVTAFPPQLMLSAKPLDARYELNVYIRNNESDPITVSEASVNLTNVQVQLNEFQKGRLFRALVNFPVGFQLPSDQKGELTVKTSHPRVPVLKVPILQKAAASPPGSGKAP